MALNQHGPLIAVMLLSRATGISIYHHGTPIELS